MAATFAACGSIEINDKPPPGQGGREFRGLSTGLLVLPDNGHIDFGRTQASAIASASKVIGAGPANVAPNFECGAGPLQIATWDQGMTLLFQNGDFVGWVATSRGFATGTGIAIGQTRQQIETAALTVRETTLGWEFDAGGVFGLFEQPDANAKVTTLWSGTTCFFR